MRILLLALLSLALPAPLAAQRPLHVPHSAARASAAPPAAVTPVVAASDPASTAGLRMGAPALGLSGGDRDGAPHLPPGGPATLALLAAPQGGASRSSLGRSARTGAWIGAAAGTVFALWVISIADCSGGHCTGERVIGVALNAAGGAVIGAGIGALVHLVRR